MSQTSNDSNRWQALGLTGFSSNLAARQQRRASVRRPPGPKNKIAPQRKPLQGDRLSLWRDGQYEPRTFEPFVQALLSA